VSSKRSNHPSSSSKTSLPSEPQAEETVAAYAAGILDGEGSIGIGHNIRNPTKPVYWIVIDVSMSEKGLVVLQWLRKNFGGSISNQRQQTERWSLTCSWRIFGDPALKLLRRVRPYLLLKSEQADIAIRLQEIRSEHPGHWEPWMRIEAASMKEKIHILNRRGPMSMPPSPKMQMRQIARFADGRWVPPQGSLFPGQPLDEFSGILPRSGSMRAGVVYEVPMSATPLIESASSLWPAPTKADARSSGRHTTSTGVMHPGTSLTDAVRAVLRQDPEMAPHCEPGLPSTVVINPEFVEALLGFPRGWSALEPSETPPCPCSSSKLGDGSASGSPREGEL